MLESLDHSLLQSDCFVKRSPTIESFVKRSSDARVFGRDLRKLVYLKCHNTIVYYPTCKECVQYTVLCRGCFVENVFHKQIGGQVVAFEVEPIHLSNLSNCLTNCESQDLRS